MSYPPKRSKAGNAFAAGPEPEPEDVQQGSVRAARERLRAIQAVRAQASRNEPSSRSRDGLVPQTSPASPPRRGEPSPLSPAFRQRTYEQDYNYQEPAPDASWPLPASRYNPPTNAPPAPRKDRSSTLPPQANSGTFYDSGSQELSPQSLEPPQPTFGGRRDGYSRLDQYSLNPAPAPSIPRRPPSATSNVSGGIPDFPLPTSQYQSGRRSQNMAQPGRNSRRGPSSHYSQLSGPFGVSPIPEESNSRATNSYASSNVIPSQMKEFFLDPTPSDEDDDRSTLDLKWSSDGEKMQQSPGLVRQASLGRLQKPALTTIRGGESLRPPVVTASVPREVPGSKETRLSQVASILDGESIFMDRSSSEKSRRTSDIGYDLSEPFNPDENKLQDFGRMASPRKAEPTGLADRRNKIAGTTDRVGSRRPPNIDVQAIREAEARASLTSLPDLIRRATRLAANLDRGRTASRLGMDWMLNDDGKAPKGYRPSEGSSLGGMLASFPPPASMARGPTPSDGDTADELYKNLNIKRTREGPKGKRKRGQICGLSRRAFVAVVLVVFFLVAAAVLLPVFLILLPNRNRSTTSTSVPLPAALQECQNNNPCSNGGTVVVNLDQSCGCICSNGFTGPQCNTQSNASCTAINAGGADGATVGTQVPDLITAAQQQFSIPLDTTALLSAFASNGMTCATENAIVTFPGSDVQKRGVFGLTERTDSGTSRPNVDAQGSTLEYTDSSSTTAPTSATPTSTPTSSTDTASSPSTTTTTPPATGTISPTYMPGMGTNSTTVQFAQVGVLFVLQDSRDLAVAVSASENLSQYLDASANRGSSMPMNNITLGSGYFIDLRFYSVTLRNGTQYGVGVNYNGTVTRANKEKRNIFADFTNRVLL